MMPVLPRAETAELWGTRSRRPNPAEGHTFRRAWNAMHKLGVSTPHRTVRPATSSCGNRPSLLRSRNQITHKLRRLIQELGITQRGVDVSIRTVGGGFAPHGCVRGCHRVVPYARHSVDLRIDNNTRDMVKHTKSFQARLISGVQRGGMLHDFHNVRAQA